MGNPPTDEERATDYLTRVGVAAGRLGIETFQLEAAGRRFGALAGRYLRVWLDTEMPRLAIRCESSSPDALAARRARARYTELDSDGGEYQLAVGTRAFAEDRVLATGVPDAALDEIAQRLELLADGRCDAVGRDAVGGSWTFTVVESTPNDLASDATRLGAMARELGVQGLQQNLLEQSHVVLGAAGYTVSVSCDGSGMRRELTLEYRNIAWNRVVGLTDALRPGTSSGTALGVFAGAFNAQHAAGMAITYRAGRPAHVRIAIDCDSDFV